MQCHTAMELIVSPILTVWSFIIVQRIVKWHHNTKMFSYNCIMKTTYICKIQFFFFVFYQINQVIKPQALIYCDDFPSPIMDAKDSTSNVMWENPFRIDQQPFSIVFSRHNASAPGLGFYAMNAIIQRMIFEFFTSISLSRSWPFLIRSVECKINLAWMQT